MHHRQSEVDVLRRNSSTDALLPGSCDDDGTEHDCGGWRFVRKAHGVDGYSLSLSTNTFTYINVVKRARLSRLPQQAPPTLERQSQQRPQQPQIVQVCPIYIYFLFLYFIKSMTDFIFSDQARANNQKEQDHSS